MIDIKELYIVNYCHPNCKPLQNIMRLPEKQAFEKAGELARKNPETNAFYRFADFENYYPRRLKADSIIYRLLNLAANRKKNIRCRLLYKIVDI